MRLPMAVWSVAVLVCVLMGVQVTQAMAGNVSVVYFTDGNSIKRLQDMTADTVITASGAPYSLDCNSCDGLVYWASQTDRTISRGSATVKTQVIVSIDLVRPVGLAVDWRSNNVYYTDDRGVGEGRVVVVTCDGKYRRILVQNIGQVGAITVDVLRGYMYWVDGSRIKWVELDGSNPAQLPITTLTSRPTDITVDYAHQKLYWAVDSQIWRSNLNGSNVETNLLTDAQATAVSVSSNVLFWLKRRTTESDSGSIFSHPLPISTSNSSYVLNPMDPHDISSFVQMPVSGGCSANNGGCQQFCFTRPSSSPISTSVSCGCNTGHRLKADNRGCNIVPDQFMLFIEQMGVAGAVTSSRIMMLSLDITDEMIPVPLPITISTEARAVTYNHVEHRVYWTEIHPPRIMRAHYNGTHKETVVSSSLFAPEGIAVDYRDYTLFWADTVLDRVEAMSLRDGLPGLRRVMAETSVNPLRHPRGLALDEMQGRLVWSDFGDSKLEQLFFNGSSRSVIPGVPDGYVQQPGPVAVRSDGHTYWANSKIGASQPAEIRGTNGFLDRLGSTVTVKGLAFLGTKLYWTETGSAGGRLMKRDDVDVELASGLHGVSGLVAVDTSSKGGEICSHNNEGCQDICLPVGDGHACTCRDHHHVTTGGQCAPDHAPLLLMSDSSHVFLWRSDGTTNTWPSGDPHWTNSTIPASAMDFDSRTRMLYWISNEDGNVYRTVITDNMTTPISFPVITCCYGTISDIAVDWWGRNLYWTDKTRGQVGVSKLDGTGHQVLASGLGQPSLLVINPYKSLIYYTDGNTVKSIPMDGSVTTPTTVWPDEFSNVSPQESSNFSVRGLVFDAEDKSLFWIYKDCVYYYQTDSTAPAAEQEYCESTHLLAETNDGFPLLITRYDSFLFILVRDTSLPHVYREGLPGTGGLAFNLGDSGPTPALVKDFIIVDSSLQPDAHPCTVTNGGCETLEDALCLVSSADAHECRCPPTMYLQRRFHSNTCQEHCQDPSSFLLLSTTSSILYMPVVDASMSNTDPTCQSPSLVPRLLPVDNLDNVRGVVYDPAHESVIWIEGGVGVNGRVGSANVDGTHRRNITSYPPISPHSLSYDWKGGHIFWTNTSGVQIELVTYSGSGQGVMLQQQSVPVPHDVSIAVAMDTTNRKLYWGDPFELRIKMRDIDTSKVEFLPLQGVVVSLLTVDESTGTLYWYETNKKEVEMYYNGTRTTVASGSVTEFTVLSAAAVDGVSTLFWYNQSTRSVHRYSQGSVQNVTRLPEGTSLTGMSAHYKSESQLLSPCASEDRPCSHLCNPSTNTCSCSLYLELSNNAVCRPTNCPAGLHACDNASDCIPTTYLCDDRKDCLDGSDERDCSCDPLTQFFCHKSTSNMCVPNSKKCDNQNDCLSGEDEDNMTCHCPTVRCALLSGITMCLPESWINDGRRDCLNGQDESPEPPNPRPQSTTILIVSTPSSTMTPPTHPTSGPGTLLITVGTVLAFSFVIVFVVLCVVAQCVMSRRYKLTMLQNNDHASSIKTSYSPQIRSEISDYSINTEETRSTQVEPDIYPKNKPLLLSSQAIANPPNSPITHRSVCDNMSFVTESDFCPGPPNPSLDFDGVSDRMSSVSQRRYPAVLAHNGSYHRQVAPVPYQQHSSYLLQYHPHANAHYIRRQFQPDTHIPQHIEIMESDNLSESSYHSRPTADYADTSFVEPEGSEIDTHQGYYDPAPPPSPVTEYCQQMEEEPVSDEEYR